MFTTFTIISACFVILAILMVLIARRSLPWTWTAFVILSAILSGVISKWPPQIASPWPAIAGLVWLLTAMIVIEARKAGYRRAMIAMIIMTIFMAGIMVFATTAKPTNKLGQVETVKTIVMPSNSSWTLEQCRSFLSSNGWTSADYNLQIDPSLDKSTSGTGAFSTPIKNSAEMVDFLKLGSEQSDTVTPAKVELNDMLSNGYAKSDILNAANWVAVQSRVKFSYPGNTSYSEGKIIAAGSKDGEVGDIFMVFIPPQVSLEASSEPKPASASEPYIDRGGCANPQTKPPIPTGEPPLEELAPKSANPADYKKPGDDNKRDSGTGTKPIVPVVTTPAESKPPVVIVTPPATPPKAPDATPVPDKPKPVPKPEDGVNPPGGGSNDTDPPNPF